MSRSGGTPRAGREPFPLTMLSAVLATGSVELETRKRAWERIARAYRSAIVSYVRFRFHRSEEDAEDIAGAFFARCVERGSFKGFDPQKARFRTFLRVCLDRFVTDELRAEKSLKRGGGSAAVGVDPAQLESAPASDSKGADAVFEAEWVRRVVTLAVEALRAELLASGKTVHLAVFERYHLHSEDAPPYADVARELGISVFDVTNRLTFARRKFRAAVLEVLRELTASEEEWKEEARAILGVAP